MVFSSGTDFFLTLVIVYILLVWGALIPFRAGLLYNGSVYCMAIGGYVAGFLSKTFSAPFIVCVLAAILVGLLLGFVPALGFARTNGIVTAISSMALIFILESVIRNMKFLGGSTGLIGIKKVNFLLVWAFLIMVVLGVFLYRLDHSRIGRALEAIQTDPQMAETLGINTHWMTVLGLTLSSVFCAAAGAIYAFNMRVLYPGTFSFTFLLNIMTMLFVGGRYTQWGVLISAPLLWSISSFAPQSIQKMSNYIYAVILIVILMVRPEGIITRKMTHKLNLFVKEKLLKRGGKGQVSAEG